MDNIISRWEWRTFGTAFIEEERIFCNYEKGKTRESSEIYILSKVSNDNTKIRDMLMDIKTLQLVNEDGLELWRPIMKAEFPLTVDEIIEVYRSFNVDTPKFDRERYSLEQFIEELIKKDNRLMAIDVYKKRTGYTINGCIAEIAEVRVNDITTKTIAIELEDPKVVISTVRELKLDKYENINYLKGLKQIVGMK